MSLVKVQDLSFGAFSVGETGGTVLVTRAGVKITTGDVVDTGGSHSAAWFVASGEANRLTNVSFSSLTATLTREGGPETLTVNLEPSAYGPASLTGDGALNINVGGTLNVPGGQEAGVYTGTFDVTVVYN